MIKTFSNEVKKAIFESQHGKCRVLNCYEPISSIHHKLNNCVAHRKKYPLFIHSPQNAIGLCENCHTQNSHLFRVTEKEAEAYERWLERFLEKGVK